MGETLNLLFEKREDGTYELQVKESWSGRTVRGNFVPPYSNKQLNALLKKLNSLETGPHELREIGQRLFLALCGSETPGAIRPGSAEQSVQAVLRGVIQRTLKRRGTVALTFCFSPDCEEFVRYPWELLHNGDHFLLVSGIFTLTRAILRQQSPVGCELPVHPPMRILYIGASPSGCTPLETERSFEALERGLASRLETGQIFLDRLEPATFDELVRYLNSYGGAGMLDDSETAIPCYAVHFDGHGAYGRLCPEEGCGTLNEAAARKCMQCGSPLTRVRPQTYLCFCDENEGSRFIDTQTLCDIFLSSDVRLAVFSACETAFVSGKDGHRHRQRNAVDATLATALVMAEVPAVVAMPFSLQDDLSPTFMYHFYEALADGRMLEEALSRARQALLPVQQKSWFIPVLYRHVIAGEEGPVPLLVSHDAPEENEHPLAHLGVSSTFVGREQELGDLAALFTAAVSNQPGITGPLKLRPGTHLLVLTGSAGIGKSTLAFEAVRQNQEKFPGGIIGVSLQDGKAFGDKLLELIHYLHIPTRVLPTADIQQRARLVISTFRSLANRELPTLLLLDGFEEVKDREELDAWLHFLCALPQEILVLVTSRSNPGSMVRLDGPHCRWYEYHVGKMTDADLLKLFSELASESGLDQHIHLEDPKQQAVLREICALLDGYPLGAELIFGAAHTIGGKLYTPEAASRSLEEICDELRSTPLAGILAVLEISYRRLTPLARLLLAYLSAFNLPFSREQITILVAPDTLASSYQPVRLARENDVPSTYRQDELCLIDEVVPAALLENWRAARDELVQASFVQFDGRVYSIHPQVRHFAMSHLPIEERRRVHRVIAAYYANLPQPGPEEWFAAFNHLESAGELQDMQEAASVAVRASWALCGRGYAPELLAMLQRAGVHASRLESRSFEGRIQCCLGAILRLLGRYTEAEACLLSSLEFHRQQHERQEAGWALYELAMLCREEGNFRQASGYAQEALAMFREAGDTRGETWQHMVVGEISRGYGAYYDALGHFEFALSSFQKLRDKEGYAFVLRDRGTVYEALGQYTKALNDYDEALRIFNELNLRTGQAWVLADRGVVYADQGNIAPAEKNCAESIAIFREQGIRRGEAWALRAMGDALWEKRDVAQARICYDEAASIFRAIGDRVDLARVLNAQGALALEEKDYLAAKDVFEQAQSMAHEHGAKQIEGRALRGLADVARVLQRFSEAERLYHDAMTIATELDTPAERCAVLRRLGALHHARSEHQDALACWVQALALDQRLGHPARTDLQQKVDALVADHDLQQAYAASCSQYGLS